MWSSIFFQDRSFSLIAAFVVFSSAENRGWSQTAYTGEELVAAVTDRLTSIDSLYCEYRVVFEENSKELKAARYARSGTKWHYAELGTDESGRNREHIFCCDNDLVYGFAITRERAGDDEWRTVQLQDPYRFNAALVPDDLLGERIANVERSLVEIFDIAGVETTQQAASNEADLGFLARSVPARNRDMRYDVSVIVDPNHDFLPREVLITESKDSVTWPGWEWRWEIQEFRRVLDEQTNEERWFPTAAVLRQGDTGAPSVRLTIDKVRVNPTLSQDLFRPDIPDGVTIYDVTTNGRGRMAIKGGHYVVDEFVESLAAHESPSRIGPVVINVVAIIVILVFLAYRRRRVARIS